MFKSIITIYSEFDPSKAELSTLANEAEEGGAICTNFAHEIVEDGVMPEAAVAFFSNDL